MWAKTQISIAHFKLNFFLNNYFVEEKTDFRLEI